MPSLSFPEGSSRILCESIPLDTNSNASGSNPRAATDDWDIDEQEFALDESDSLDALGSDSSDEDLTDQDSQDGPSDNPGCQVPGNDSGPDLNSPPKETIQLHHSAQLAADSMGSDSSDDDLTDKDSQDGPSDNPGGEVPGSDSSPDINAPPKETIHQDHSAQLGAYSMPSASGVSGIMKHTHTESFPSEDKVDSLEVPSASEAGNLQENVENMPKNVVKNSKKTAAKKVSFDTKVTVMDFQGSSSMVEFDCEELRPSPAYDSSPAASSEDWDLDEEFTISTADSLDAMESDSSDEDCPTAEEGSQEIPSPKHQSNNLVHGMSDDSEDTLDASSNQVDRLSSTSEMVDIQPSVSNSMVNNEYLAHHQAQSSMSSEEATDEWDIDNKEFAVDRTNSLDAIENDSSDEDISVEDHDSCDTPKDGIPKTQKDFSLPKATASAETPSASSMSIPSAFAPKVNKYIKTEAPCPTGATHNHSRASPWRKDPPLSSSMVSEEVYMDLPCSINTMPGTSTSGLPVQMDSDSSSSMDPEKTLPHVTGSIVPSSSTTTTNENSTSQTNLTRGECQKILTKMMSKAIKELETGRATPMVDFNAAQKEVVHPALPNFRFTSYTASGKGRFSCSSKLLEPSSKKSLAKRRHKSKSSGSQQTLLRCALFNSAAVRRARENNGSWQESLTDRERQEFREMTKKIVRASIFSDLSEHRHATETWSEKLKWYVKLGMRFGARHPDPAKRKTLFTYLSHKMDSYYAYYFRG